MVMSLGHIDSPTTFIRMPNEVLILSYFIHDLASWKHTCVLPNRNIYTINQVFVVLHGEKLLININKCTFKQQEQIYLRLCQKQNGLSINLRKILTIVDWLPLNNIHHLLDFMRMVSYLRDFTISIS